VSAFAAIAGDDVGELDVATVGAAISRIYGTPARTWAAAGCTLIAAPLHGDGRAHGTDQRTGVTAVGQVVLEGKTALARELALPADADALDICVAAYLRWGDLCTDRFSGEFALALFDPRDRTLLCARDGLGIRQVFVGDGGRTVVVSNALAATWGHRAVPRDLDEKALLQFLSEGWLEPERTAFRSVTCLAAGHTLVLRNGVPLLRRHWAFPVASGRAIRDVRAACDGYREVMRQAVADRLIVAGASILMSGGIDSTSIAAAACEVGAADRLMAFTAVYNRAPVPREWETAALAADALGVPQQPVAGDRHDALHYLDQPGLPPQPVDEPTLSDWRGLVAAAASHASVALYGEDGDSLFLPPSYSGLRHTMTNGEIARDSVAFAWRRRQLPYLGLRIRERFGLVRRPPRTPVLPPWLTREARALLAVSEPPCLLGQQATPLGTHPARPRTQERLCRGVGEYMSGLISAEVTRQAIELRCPLLDRRVIAFVMQVAPIPFCQDKDLPRRAYAGALPAAVRLRPKRGVSGLDERLARDWQARRPGTPRLTPPLDRWIDRAALDAALVDPLRVGGAWRVVQLAGWLARRDTSSPAWGLCTACANISV
jgi:asparagine synthase (glutamine-hydrolysing)